MPASFFVPWKRAPWNLYAPTYSSNLRPPRKLSKTAAKTFRRTKLTEKLKTTVLVVELLRSKSACSAYNYHKQNNYNIMVSTFFRMRKLHCSIFIVLTIGALDPQVQSLCCKATKHSYIWPNFRPWAIIRITYNMRNAKEFAHPKENYYYYYYYY